MAVIGYVIGAESGGGILDHTMSDHLFYNATASLWHATAQDTTGSDWALWGKRSADPGSTGGTGGFDHEVDDAGTPADVYVDTRDGASIVNFWDPDTDILHTLSFDNATERYQQWTYNSGTDDWTHTVSDESPGIDTNTTEGNCILIVDADGDPWIVYHDIADLKLKAIVRSGGSWGTPVVIEATASTSAIGVLRVDGARWLDDTGAAGIFVCYSYGISGGNKNRMAYRLDSAGLTASWTTEDIETSASIDNHISVQAMVLAADSGTPKSTICMSAKPGSGNTIDFYKRSTGSPGTWAKTTSIRTDSTRPKCVIDETNEEIYVFCNLTAAGGTGVVYRKSDINTISFDTSDTVVLENNADTFNVNMSLPNKPVTSATDLYVLGHSQGSIWWNRVTIAAAAATNRLLLINPPGLGGGLSL